MSSVGDFLPHGRSWSTSPSTPRRCRSRDCPAPNPRSTRNRYSAEFKVKVALDAIKGELTISQLGAKYGVHQTMINVWKKKAIDKLSTFLTNLIS